MLRSGEPEDNVARSPSLKYSIQKFMEMVPVVCK